MIAFRDFRAEDVVALALQPSQHFEFGLWKADLDLAYGRDLAEHGVAWTAYEGDRILCCAGFRETFPPVQAVAWALFAADLAPGEGGVIARFARRRFDDAPYRRLEAIVEVKNRRARKLADFVGLEPGALLENFGFASEPHILFERIR